MSKEKEKKEPSKAQTQQNRKKALEKALRENLQRRKIKKDKDND